MEGHRHPLALVVEDDDNQRALLSVLLEESEMEVLECDSRSCRFSFGSPRRVSVVFVH
jgi:CheY-like chemotaxis protein